MRQKAVISNMVGDDQNGPCTACLLCDCRWSIADKRDRRVHFIDSEPDATGENLSSGPNQHYLPRFLQKPFGIRPKRKEIWVFARGVAPEPKRLKEVGASEYFYSDPAADSARTLDDDITDIETPISRILAGIRAQPVGAVVNSTDAAEIVNHLVPRTAHVRVNMERGPTPFSSRQTFLGIAPRVAPTLLMPKANCRLRLQMSVCSSGSPSFVSDLSVFGCGSDGGSPSTSFSH
ncbi:hypothetical protein [Sinorhizobium sp. 22678]|uniref:hypothetical protein n=1 Tax=Sinorhizobium sp. 22678 TaxID=3453955 RepID=UPI003F85EE58